MSLPVPAIKDGQILIRVAYAGVNFIDSYFASGLYVPAVPFGRFVSLAAVLTFFIIFSLI